jgi:hypothetical protein
MEERTLLNFRSSFQGGSGNYTHLVNFTSSTSDDIPDDVKTIPDSDTIGSKGKITKLAVTPKSILHELEMDVNAFSLQGLDDKIAIIKEKCELIKQIYAKREMSALLICLENRKKFYINDKNGVPFSQFFSQFKTTSDQKIDDVLKKYKLVVKSADIFIPEFPDEAIKAMKEYKEKVIELCDKEPQFVVIATEDSFKKNYEKRDPVLLALSPFGFFYYILGAWDEEMKCLTDL